jgi:hypothetical protein
MSIVLGIIKGFIGSWGLNAVDFYMANSLWINGSILLYALIISTCWRNYETIKKSILQSITSQLELKGKSWSKAEISRSINSAQISWESEKKHIRIPLIAKSGSYMPKFASVEAIEKLFPKDLLINTIRNSNKKQEV